MVRKLKHHEQKLLKKVDFITYKSDNNHRDHEVIRRYDFVCTMDAYNRLCGSIRQYAHKLSQLSPESAFRRKHEDLLLEKLYDMGVLAQTSKMSSVEKITVSAFARRRLPVVMQRLKMSETISGAIKLIEQGHVRVGTEVVTDPAYLVNRSMEDFITWSEGSKIKRHVMKYKDRLDDFELL
ncbi:U3 small nucleolar ribonucleoprotein IMP3 [Apiospora phragmitis]|uniref:U3 small nucleolar ribonucleoprotein IMP3 n=1 Tax=Apiospora phragmitis TaxID=2905665 RepID=A0ABR1TQ88_9PEZI